MEFFFRTINRLTFFPRVEVFEFTKIMMEYIIKFHLSNHSSKALEKPQIDCDDDDLVDFDSEHHKIFFEGRRSAEQ